MVHDFSFVSRSARATFSQASAKKFSDSAEQSPKQISIDGFLLSLNRYAILFNNFMIMSPF